MGGAGKGGLALKPSYSFCHQGTIRCCNFIVEIEVLTCIIVTRKYYTEREVQIRHNVLTPTNNYEVENSGDI